MTDGIARGWDVALTVLGTFLGALPVIAVVALIAYGVPRLLGDIAHRTRVHRLHRQTRRDGRVTDRIMAQARSQDAPPNPFPCHCRSLPPGRRDLTGHEPGCPDHPQVRSA